MDGDEIMHELNIPSFLRYPDDPFSEKMFRKQMRQIQNDRCFYRFMLYTGIADPVPETEGQFPLFEINETHYYTKKKSRSWYSVSIMKDRSVADNTVCSWVEKADRFTEMFGIMDQVLRTPAPMRGKTYQEVAVFDLEEWPDYNWIHGFDESHVYARVFYLDRQLYKKFILVAKKQDISWRVEVNTPSETEQIIPPDFVPAGQTFGCFCPVGIRSE